MKKIVLTKELLEDIRSRVISTWATSRKPLWIMMMQELEALIIREGGEPGFTVIDKS